MSETLLFRFTKKVDSVINNNSTICYITGDVIEYCFIKYYTVDDKSGTKFVFNKKYKVHLTDVNLFDDVTILVFLRYFSSNIDGDQVKPEFKFEQSK